MNPIVSGWYADPEARFFDGRYYVYVTKSFSAYAEQLNIDCFSSDDLEHWEKHSDIIDMSGYPYVHRAVWAPTAAERKGKYYLIFASNDIQNDSQYGGLEIAVSDSPSGPFKNLLSRPLINKFVNYAQPIDAHLFTDDDGAIYLYWGGWQHCNVAVMNESMDGFIPIENGDFCKNITPNGYVEAPCMLKRNGIYHFMWSEGDWTNGTYRVCESHGKTPLDINPRGKVILSNSPVAEGAGHHSCININGTDDYLIFYHRRIIGDKESGHRILCKDKLIFEGEEILPVIMT